MKDVSMAQAKASLSELALRTRGGERFRLLRRGKAVAALVPLEDLGRIEQREAAATFAEAARQFAATLPPAGELPDLADLLPRRKTKGRRASRR